MIECDQPEDLWLTDYTTEDLTRALIRQYFVQNRLTKTLKMFEQQQICNAKKINKSVLIKMLSLTNLYQQNKSFEKPWKSLIQILVSYLKNKFKYKVQKNRQNKLIVLGIGSKSQQCQTTQLNRKFSMDHTKKNSQPQTKEDSLNQMLNLHQKNNKLSKTGFEHRPSTAKAQNQNYPITNFDTFDQNNTSLNNMGGVSDKESSNEQKIININKQVKFSVSQANNKYEETHNKKIELDQFSMEGHSQNLRKQVSNFDAKQQKVQDNKQQQKKNEITQKQVTSRTGGMRKWKKNSQTKNQPEIQIQQQKKQQQSQKQDQNAKNPKQSMLKLQQPATSLIQAGNKKQNSQAIVPIEQNKMVKMFGKKKKQQNTQKQYKPQKFQFDQNFVDKPLNVRQKYNYEKFNFSNVTIASKQDSTIKYTDKPAGPSTSIAKKKIQKPLSQSQIKQLKKVIFQNNSHILPKSWHQGFILSPFQTTPYGLKQIEGGPCGIIAALQCYYLKHLLYLSQPKTDKDISNETRRQISLVAAITDILMKVRSQDKIYLVIPPRNFAGAKLDIANMSVVIVDSSSFSQAYETIWQYKSSFIGQNNHGVTSLMFSIVMTKHTQNIVKQIDCRENPLIGHHGHCTQELVNLFITGKAVSNCFDGQKILEDDYKLRGIDQKAQFGFLTIFETLKYIQVGKNLKKPKYPFWIICKQFHYHVIFANHYLISENDGNGNSDNEKFDIVYYDGLYNCGDKIIITLQKYPFGQQPQIKLKELPLIQQVMMTKWGVRKADWNGSIKIL